MKKPLITITVVERDTYARRVAQLACHNHSVEIDTIDSKLASEIAEHLVEAGAEVRIVKEAPLNP